MELHELQRDIQGLQSKVIAIRGEKDNQIRILKLQSLSDELLRLSKASDEMIAQFSQNSSSTDVESHNEKTDISQPKDDTPTPQT